MQHLRSGNWVSVSALPDSPSTKVKVVELGWVERRGRGPEVCYRITESGLEALRVPMPTKSKSSLDSGHLPGTYRPRWFARLLQLVIIQARRPWAPWPAYRSHPLQRSNGSAHRPPAISQPRDLAFPHAHTEDVRPSHTALSRRSLLWQRIRSGTRRNALRWRRSDSWWTWSPGHRQPGSDCSGLRDFSP